MIHGNISFSGPDITQWESVSTIRVSRISAVSPRFISHRFAIKIFTLMKWVQSISFFKDGNFNIVFAIKKDYESAYKALARWV